MSRKGERRGERRRFNLAEVQVWRPRLGGGWEKGGKEGEKGDRSYTSNRSAQHHEGGGEKKKEKSLPAAATDMEIVKRTQKKRGGRGLSSFRPMMGERRKGGTAANYQLQRPAEIMQKEGGGKEKNREPLPFEKRKKEKRNVLP